MILRQHIEHIWTVQDFGDPGELLQRYSSAWQLLGKGFLTQNADFSEKALSRSLSKGKILGRGFLVRSSQTEETLWMRSETRPSY